MNKDSLIRLVNEQMWAKTDADIPQFSAGDTITVTYRIIEGSKERLQSFRGVVIQIKRFFLADLLRFFRLFRYGHWSGPNFRISLH